MRIVLFLGKGGVGKTTVAAATALRCAELGHRTLVASTDIAHSLADSLDVPLGDRPVQIAENLWAQEISAVADVQSYWETLTSFVSENITERGVNRIIADELSTFPGMDEIVCLLHINKQAKEQNFDRVIIDAAPTGETIRLLTMPDTFRWYASHLFRLEKGVMGMLRPFTGRLLKGPAELMETINRLDQATAELRETLSDPEITTYRVVLQPEKMVMREAERAISYLGLFNYPVDAVVVNRVMPYDPDQGEFYQARQAIQQKYRDLIRDNFAPLPQFEAPYYAEEVVGVEALSRLARDCYGDEDPGKIFFTGQLQEIEERPDGSVILRLSLPFVKGGDLNLRKRGDELFITVGNFKREMILPTVLAKRRALGGRLLDGRLEIEFSGTEPEPVAVGETAPG